jgi:hypothetical protein
MSIHTTPPRPPRRARTQRGLVVAGASAAALLVWAVADPVAGINLRVHDGGGGVRPVGPAAVATVSLLAGLAGWAFLAVLERFNTRSRRPTWSLRVWTVTAVAVLVVSLAGPLGSGVDGASAATLAGMHLVVAAVLIAGLRGRRLNAADYA